MSDPDSGMRGLEQTGVLYFLDGSRLFEEERATTFTDIWHFSDFGQAILGRAVARRILEILPRAGG